MTTEKWTWNRAQEIIHAHIEAGTVKSDGTDFTQHNIVHVAIFRNNTLLFTHIKREAVQWLFDCYGHS